MSLNRRWLLPVLCILTSWLLPLFATNPLLLLDAYGTRPYGLNAGAILLALFIVGGVLTALSCMALPFRSVALRMAAAIIFGAGSAPSVFIVLLAYGCGFKGICP